jgi:hypothetical protein
LLGEAGYTAVLATTVPSAPEVKRSRARAVSSASIRCELVADIAVSLATGP